MRIRIRISGLIQIRIRLSAVSLPKCRGFIILVTSVFRRLSWKTAGDCMRNANKAPTILYSAMAMEAEKWSVSETGSPAKVNKFFWLVGQSKHQVSVKSSDYFWSNPAHIHYMFNKYHVLIYLLTYLYSFLHCDRIQMYLSASFCC